MKQGGIILINDGTELRISGGSFQNDGALIVGEGSTGLLRITPAGTHAGTFNIKNGAEIILSGINTITNQFFTNNGKVTTFGNAALNFAGNAPQSIFGDGLMGSVTINNPDDVVIEGSQGPNSTGVNTLTLTDGNLILKDSDFEVNAVNGGGANSFVLTSGDGQLVQTFNVPRLFPVGPADGIYCPATIQQFGAQLKFGVRVSNTFDVPTNGSDRVEGNGPLIPLVQAFQMQPLPYNGILPLMKAVALIQITVISPTSIQPLSPGRNQLMMQQPVMAVFVQGLKEVSTSLKMPSSVLPQAQLWKVYLSVVM